MSKHMLSGGANWKPQKKFTHHAGKKWMSYTCWEKLSFKLHWSDGNIQITCKIFFEFAPVVHERDILVTFKMEWFYWVQNEYSIFLAVPFVISLVEPCESTLNDQKINILGIFPGNTLRKIIIWPYYIHFRKDAISLLDGIKFQSKKKWSC